MPILRSVRRRSPGIWQGSLGFPAPPGPPLDLPEAIAAYLLAASSLATAFGSAGPTDIRFWADEAPDDPPLPYAVVTDPDEAFDDWSTADATGAISYWGYPQVQISIFASTRAQARALGWLMVDAVGKDIELTFQRGTLHWLRIEHGSTQKDPDPAVDGADCFQRILMFNASVDRTL